MSSHELPSSPQTLPASVTETRWVPYSGSKDFNTTMLIILLILFLSLLFFLFLHALRRRRAQPVITAVAGDNVQQKATAVLVFSAGMERADVECAICLCEFMDGEGLMLLVNCNHWFHVLCIEAWLFSGHRSCPTCRSNCVSDAYRRAEDC